MKRILHSRWFQGITLLIILAVAYFVYMGEWANFHTVTKDKAYRAAKMDWDELEFFTHRKYLKTILNLTGAHPKEKWYQEELEFCIKHNLTHIDIPFSSRYKPTPKNIEELMRVYREAPLPILIHCKSGADRTGLACALWQYAVEGKSAKVSKREFSWYYGHFPIFGTQILDDCFDKWVQKHPPEKMIRK